MYDPSLGAANSELPEPPPTTTDEQNKVLDELCISISNMLLNTLQPVLGPFKVRHKWQQLAVSTLSKKTETKITATDTVVALGDEKSPNEMNESLTHTLHMITNFATLDDRSISACVWCACDVQKGVTILLLLLLLLLPIRTIKMMTVL